LNLKKYQYFFTVKGKYAPQDEVYLELLTFLRSS